MQTELWQLGLAKAPQAAAAVVSFMQQLKSLAPAGTLTTSAADVHLFMASKTKALQWQQAFEADEVACAVLARLRVPSEQWASALRAWGASQLRELERCTGIWEQAAKMAVDKGGATAAVYAATAARLGWPSFEEGAARLREAVARGDVDDAAQLCEAFLATLAYSLASYKLSSEAGRGVGEDSSDEHCTKYGTSRVCPSSIVGPGACPEPAAPAMLTDLRTTMPPFSARLAHVQHLAGQLPMQLRPTAPPVAVGGRYSPGSVAEQIVKRGTDAMKAEKAGEQAAQQEEDAPKPAAASR